jgi:hypothetical protein
MRHYDLRVFADYRQFYVWDAGVDPQAPEDYDNSDIVRMVKVAPHVLVVQPVRVAEVPVELEVHSKDPGYNSADWDHIVEADIALATGALQVHECTGGAILDLHLSPGAYRVRVLFAGLGASSDDGLHGDDRYRVVLWPGGPRGLEVVKQWTGGVG